MTLMGSLYCAIGLKGTSCKLPNESVKQCDCERLFVTHPKAVGPPQASPSGVVVHLGSPARAITVTLRPYLHLQCHVSRSAHVKRSFAYL